MNNLMIYLIFNIESIRQALVIAAIALASIGGIILFALVDVQCLIPDESDDKETVLSRRIMKTLIITAILLFTIGAFLPKKETLIAMQVKNLATLENYNWTVEQLKGAVDYIVEAINKIGR